MTKSLALPKAMKTPKKKDSQPVKDDFPLAHISSSSIIKFSSNPLLFKITYVNRDYYDTTISASAVLGQAFHHAMETYFGGNDTMIASSEEEAIANGLKVGMSFLEQYNDGFITYTTGIQNKQDLFDKFTFCFNEYVTKYPYQINSVISVEEEILEHIDIEWKGKRLTLPVKLKGYLDKVFDDNGELAIEDYKVVGQFSDPDKIDGAKIIQAIQYYLLAYARYNRAPKKFIFTEVKHTKNSAQSQAKFLAEHGHPMEQVQRYEIIFDEHELYFEFYFRMYEDLIRALNGEQVYVPNVYSLYDNEIGIIAYIHRLDVPENSAKLMRKHQVNNITELLKKEMQSAGNMRKLMKMAEKAFVQAKNINYEAMKPEEKIQTKMMEHGMLIQFDSIIQGASVDMYRYTPSIGLKMSRIRNYVDDVEQVLGIAGIRILAPIPGSTMVGFEIPREERTFPKLPAMDGFNLAIGQTIDGNVRRFDIRQAPHMLVAGSTGSGKSVFLNAVIHQLLNIKNAQLYLFDPKQVELSHFEGMKGVAQYESDAKKIALSLDNLVKEMENRYSEMKARKVKNISELGGMPYLFVIIDEYADLTIRGGVEGNIQLIAQKGRACGIHLIIATQRASTRIINGDIKINFPTRVVFKMAKGVDSRVMLDEDGAEKLLGKGDCLFAGDSGIERLQGYSI